MLLRELGPSLLVVRHSGLVEYDFRLRLPRKIVESRFKRMHPATAPENCRSLFGFDWLGDCRCAKRRVAFLLLLLGGRRVIINNQAGSTGFFEATGSRV